MLKKFAFLASAASVSALLLAGCQDEAEDVEMSELEAAQEDLEQGIVPGEVPEDPDFETVDPESQIPGNTPDMPGEQVDDARQALQEDAGADPDSEDVAYDPAADYGEPSARGDFEFADGAGQSGTAWFFEAPDGVRVYVRVRGMDPGAHAIHVHTTGDCSASDFTSAGPHLGENAGQVLPDKPDDFEAGVLPDIEVATDGTGMLTAVLDTVVFTGADDTTWPILDENGSAVVIHRESTAEDTDGSNARIACAEIYESDM